MPELTNEATRTAAILQQIADKVAPLTRFGRSSFTATGIETIGAIITAEMRYTISFSRINDAGYGGLPSGTFTVPGDRALDSHIQKLRQTAEHELPQRLERWAAAQPAPPGSPLAEKVCYDESPPAGYSYSCSACGGRGLVTCGTCRGRLQPHIRSVPIER